MSEGKNLCSLFSLIKRAGDFFLKKNGSPIMLKRHQNRQKNFQNASKKSV